MGSFFDSLKEWYAEREANQLKFEKFLHKGVKLQHISSKVTWTVIDVEIDNQHGKIVTIRSKKGYKKIITRTEANTYKFKYIPKTIKILFGG